MSDTKWPVFVELCRINGGGIPVLCDASDHYCEDFGYTLVDAARAWQAFRDFLNGTPKEWARHALDQYLRGVKEGLNGGQA